MHIVLSFFEIYTAVEMGSTSSAPDREMASTSSTPSEGYSNRGARKPDSSEMSSTSSTPSEWYTSRGARKPLSNRRKKRKIIKQTRTKVRSLSREALDQHEVETAHHPLPEAWPEGIREVGVHVHFCQETY